MTAPAPPLPDWCTTTFVTRLATKQQAVEQTWAQVEEPTTTGRPMGWSLNSDLVYLLLDTDARTRSSTSMEMRLSLLASVRATATQSAPLALSTKRQT